MQKSPIAGGSSRSHGHGSTQPDHQRRRQTAKVGLLWHSREVTMFKLTTDLRRTEASALLSRKADPEGWTIWVQVKDGCRGLQVSPKPSRP